MNVVLITIITLGALGATAAIILYFVAQKFKVFEDPRIDQVEDALILLDSIVINQRSEGMISL